MTVLSVLNVHEKPGLLFKQIQNANLAFGNKIAHMININKVNFVEFDQISKRRGIDFAAFGNVFFTENPIETGHMHIFHAWLLCILEAKRRNIKFEYIMFNSPYSLFVKKDVYSYIKNFDLGYNDPGILAVNFEPNFEVKLPLPWNISLNPRIPVELKNLGHKTLFKRRVEGCFFKRDFFFEMIYPSLLHSSAFEHAERSVRYPAEEFVFAQCVQFFCERQKVRRTRNLVFTSTAPSQWATFEEINKTHADPQMFGIKRFRESDTPERLLVNDLMNDSLAMAEPFAHT